MSIAQNKKAHLEYEILEKFEAGIVLSGEEIKAIRAHRVNLNGTFCHVQKGEVYVLNMHISETKEPERTRKLLMHKSEIRTLIGKTDQKGFSIIPLSIYLKKGKAKLEIALARGKKLYDHRDDLRNRDIKRQAELDASNA
jgi:SsrA-binding protein